MKKLLVILVVALLWLPIQAQNSSEVDSLRNALHALSEQQYSSTLTLTMDEAKDYALRQNRSLQNASLEVKKAHAQRWQAIAGVLPQLDGSIGKSVMYDDEWNEKMINLTGTPASMSPWSYKLTAAVGINGQAIVGMLLSNIAIQMQEITREQTETELRANVVESYIAALVLEDVVTLLDSSLQNLQKLARQTQVMANVGSVEQTQADQIMVRVNQLKNTVYSNQRTLKVAYNALRVLLNVDANTQLVLTSPLSELLSQEQAYGLLMEQLNINRNYDYQLLQKNVDLAKMNVHMAGWAYGPTLSAYYQYNYNDYGNKEGFTMMTTPNTVGLTVAMPIWSSGKRAAGVTEKKIALQEAQNTMQEATDNLGVRYQQLRYNLINACETFLTEKENLEVTNRVFTHITNKYNWGAASSLDLTTASNDLITAESNYVNSALTLVNAKIELEKFLNNK